MDDSDQDFVDLCSKLLKRVRKKPGESKQPKRAVHKPSCQASDGDKRRRNTKRDADSGSVSTAAAEGEKPVVCGGTEHDAGEAEVSAAPSTAAGQRAERGLTAKDKVLHRMQQFKRASPQKMMHKDQREPSHQESDPPSHLTPRLEPPESLSSALLSGPQDSDEALALQLQQELDREAAVVQTVDLEEGGLFFCQICHRDLSHMTPEGRTQHLNRCLDDSEESAPAPPPPPPGIPDCPICGKKFKSHKSRSAHLKRCSSDMGVAPAVLLQALHRQTEETPNVPPTNPLIETGGNKRKGPPNPSIRPRKKPRKKIVLLDEDTMVALALSSSLLEQEQQIERMTERQLQTAAPNTSMTAVLKWRPDKGKGRGKRKKGGVPCPPPLLLVQDAEAALTRLQERVSALLLRSRAPSPPTPTRCPSSLPGWSGAAPLWQKSTLLDRASTCASDFYTPELREFITPWELATPTEATKNPINRPDTPVLPVSEGAPDSGTRVSILPASTPQMAPSTPGTGQLPAGSQALLMELMELAEDGVTLTQCGHIAPGPDKDKGGSQITNLHLSGFVLDEPEEPAGVSSFLPETAHTHLDTRGQARRKTDPPGADQERQTVAQCRLASDLSSMVNNPQLSDLQLQVDSGDVFFAHSFMVYARCPLLAEMVHESGFGVQEEGSPAAQRVLLNDVPGQAVLALLQYLYTARCSITPPLKPHVLELASRFDLQELQQLCEPECLLKQEEYTNEQMQQTLSELLRSMWDEEDEDDVGGDTDRGRDEEQELEEGHQAEDLPSGDREIGEEKVNEEELEEIYEFAATQRKREEEKDSIEEEEEEEEEEKVDEEEGGDEVFAKLTEPERSSAGFNEKEHLQIEPDPSLERSYCRLFSESWGVYEEHPPSVPSTSGLCRTHTPQAQQFPHKPSFHLSGRTLLQSSASVVEDLSPSPPPSTSNLPIPGQSPGPEGDGEEGQTSKRESQGRRSFPVPQSRDSPQGKNEPELIVLSDSSEDTEVVLSSRSPSPHSPRVVHNLQSYTQIKPQPALKPNDPTLENKQCGSLELSPDGEPGQSPSSLVDCSPEVSWLIPSTPLQTSRGSNRSSTQTKSSMCRMQLFPKADTSSLSSFSSPALPSNDRPHTSRSPTRVSAHVIQTEANASKFKLHSFRRSSSSGARKDRRVFAVSPSQPNLSISTSSKQDTSPHIQPPARLYSSTPLHTELHKAPVLLTTSPFHSSPDRSWTSQREDRAPSESKEKTELGSFHFSPLSDPSDRPSSCSLRGRHRHSESSSQNRRSVDSHSKSGSELERRGIRQEDGQRETECEYRDRGDEEEQDEAETGEAEVAESSFRQSFMDEPPIAFNDSWGLDACVDENPGCFSLRMEDSGASSLAKDPASSTEHQTPPSSLRPIPSSSKASCTAAHKDFSFTPSPPDPPNRTTTEIANSLLASNIWDSWEEEEALPLCQRLNPSAQLKTPVPSHNKRRRTLVPITPLPQYSDMDTPELKTKLNRFGVRPLPKRQMILKLKEIHQYTHQLVSSEEEEEAPPAQLKPPPTSLASCTQRVKFREPQAPAAVSPLKASREEAEALSASQGSNTSSTAASEESERSNPELCLSSDSDSDGGLSASQSVNRLQDCLRAVRSFILSDSALYSQIVQYQPLVLSQLQERLKAAGIRLAAAKLVDYLDSQCITFTTAKPGHRAPSRRRGKKTGTEAKAAGRKKAVTANI
ncbi:structure-specific endonuclease subunit SLX4 [Eleginops maclovinus]|uniref:structure-specific endonuclease subunit SLX4 n=1 Tax=Eleginops maclovinus TaxID=56733 RepID=UPI003080F65F